MKKVEIDFAKKQARLTMQKGAFDAVATQAALQAAGFGGGAKAQ